MGSGELGVQHPPPSVTTSCLQSWGVQVPRGWAKEPASAVAPLVHKGHDTLPVLKWSPKPYIVPNPTHAVRFPAHPHL